MHRPDNSWFLLYIEPQKEEKAETPIEDEITRIMRIALSESISGRANYFDLNDTPEFFDDSGWRGYHRTDCGERSTSCDYLLENGMITNSLCVFYLQYYRSSIPASEMEKVEDLVAFFKNKYKDNPAMLLREIPDYSKMDMKTRSGMWFEESEDDLSSYPKVEEPKK